MLRLTLNSRTHWRNRNSRFRHIFQLIMKRVMSRAAIITWRAGECRGGLLVGGLAAVLAINLIVTGLMVGSLVLRGESLDQALTGVGTARVLALGRPGVGVTNDSMFAMLASYRRETTNPQADLYSVVWEGHNKFQYPPASLLLLDLIPSSLIGTEGGVSPAVNRAVGQILWVCVLLTSLVCAAIFETSLAMAVPSLHAVSLWLRLARIGLVVGLVLGFYPVLKGYTLGQFQVVLNLGLSTALLAYMLGWSAVAGCIVACCSLVKPHYGLLLLWGLLLREPRFVMSFVVSLSFGLMVSIWRFGMEDHMNYVRVIRLISSHGEAFWPNQSFNGLLNRVIGNGSPVQFSFADFAPYNRFVHISTVVSSLTILGLGWISSWTGRGRPILSRAVTLATAIVAITMASPIAWEHHYGVLPACFALAVPYFMRLMPGGIAWVLLVCISYLLTANALLRPEILFSNRVTGILGSHIFFGSMMLFALLLLTVADQNIRAIPRGARRPEKVD